MVHRLLHTCHHDWEHSREIDLSDEGLLADLEKRNEAGAGTEKLVLAGGGPQKSHKGNK